MNHLYHLDHPSASQELGGIIEEENLLGNKTTRWNGGVVQEKEDQVKMYKRRPILIVTTSCP